jgi:hypothetical protein
MKLPFLFCLFAICTMHAAPIQFQSSDRQTSLLELYTSEGCSSCPPAEAWLSKLKDASSLWTNFVPVAFHVDYWNRLGWRDPFSDEQFSARQQSYAQLWSAENIYTPEFVLNGKEWRNWFGLRGAPATTEATPGVLQTSSQDGRHWTVTFSPHEHNPKDYEVTAAVLVSGVGIDVKSGENAGRHLLHDFAAISLATRPLANQTNVFAGSFVIDDHPKNVFGRLALAVWVTRASQLEPVQATGGWLP